ncbi:MAG: hypothetical protein R3F30_06405 [Planctomycetota bacterium]
MSSSDELSVRDAVLKVAAEQLGPFLDRPVPDPHRLPFPDLTESVVALRPESGPSEVRAAAMGLVDSGHLELDPIAQRMERSRFTDGGVLLTDKGLAAARKQWPGIGPAPKGPSLLLEFPIRVRLMQAPDPIPVFRKARLEHPVEEVRRAFNDGSLRLPLLIVMGALQMHRDWKTAKQLSDAMERGFALGLESTRGSTSGIRPKEQTVNDKMRELQGHIRGLRSETRNGALHWKLRHSLIFDFEGPKGSRYEESGVLDAVRSVVDGQR